MLRKPHDFFDGPQPVSAFEIGPGGGSGSAALFMDQQNDATARAFYDGQGSRSLIFLPNRR